MKKWIIGLFTLVAVLSVTVTTVFAAACRQGRYLGDCGNRETYPSSSTCVNDSTCPDFENRVQDGTCVNTACPNNGDCQQDGTCTDTTCPNFADDDGDSTCDTVPLRHCRTRQTGTSRHAGAGHGCGGRRSCRN